MQKQKGRGRLAGLRELGVVFALLLPALPAAALSFGIDTNSPSQSDFHAVAGDMTAAFDYKPLEPSDAGGVTGFALGAYGSYAPTRDSGAWSRLTGDPSDQIGVAGVSARKGLPFGIDVGGFYGWVADTDAHVYGGDLRYAVLAGSALVPAVALRASYTGASNLGDLSYRSYGVDASVSKGFPFLAPYAGIGYVWSTIKADGQYHLESESIDRVKAFAGLRLALGPLETTAEYERLGSNNVYDLRFGVSF